MPTARHWTALHLLTSWIGVCVALVPLRWVLNAGIYAATLEEGTVERISGAWSAGFATNLWLLCAVTSIGVMSALTATWMNGRRARASMREAEASVHRQVLM